MSRHQMLTRLAQYFQVVWVNPATEWRKFLEFTASGDSNTRNGLPLRGFHVYEPGVWFPLVYRPKWLARQLTRARLRSAREELIRRGVRRVMLTLWSSEFCEALDLIPFDTSSYHVVDENSYSAVEGPPSEAEVHTLRSVNQVIVRSVHLRERKRAYNSNITLIPNGVDFDLFAEPHEEPADLATIPHPRIGYIGYLKKTLDWPLLKALALRHPSWQFVFVGKESRHAEIAPFVTELSAQANVRFLGEKRPLDLARYPQHFDVCMMPYVINAYTQNIYPLKLHEFLAGGRPAVGSRISTLEQFSDILFLAGNAAEWSAALAKALDAAENTSELVSRRQAVAKQYDWEILTRKCAWTLLQGLTEDYVQRFLRLLEQSGIRPRTWLTPIREDEGARTVPPFAAQLANQGF